MYLYYNVGMYIMEWHDDILPCMMRCIMYNVSMTFSFYLLA